MKFKPDDIKQIELRAVNWGSSRACGGQSWELEVDMKKKRRKYLEDPRCDSVVLKNVSAKGNLVTFRVKIKEETLTEE